MNIESRIRKLEAEAARQSPATMYRRSRCVPCPCQAGMATSLAAGPEGSEAHKRQLDDYAAAKSDYDREVTAAGYNSEPSWPYPGRMSCDERQFFNQVKSMHASMLPPSIVDAAFPDSE